MNTTGRGFRTSPPKSNSSRSTSPSSAKQASKSSSPEEGQVVAQSVSVLSIREQGKYSGGKGVNFLKKNRQAVRTFYKRTGVPITADEPSSEGTTQLRTKLGTPHLIGDEIGTPSNKGSSYFLSASHNGVREPHKRVTAKKQQNSNS